MIVVPGFISSDLNFVHVPFNGGTSIGYWLYKNYSKGELDFDHLQLSKLVKDKNTPTFAVIRNPWERLVTAYLYTYEMSVKGAKIFIITDSSLKEERIQNSESPEWESYINQYKAYPEFKSWVKAVSNFKKYQVLPFNIITPQSWWLDGRVDHLLRYETLDEDFKAIQKLTNCVEPLEFHNVTNQQDYRSYYDDESKELVASWFSEDIYKWDYKF